MLIAITEIVDGNNIVLPDWFKPRTRLLPMNPAAPVTTINLSAPACA